MRDSNVIPEAVTGARLDFAAPTHQRASTSPGRSLTVLTTASRRAESPGVRPLNRDRLRNRSQVRRAGAFGAEVVTAKKGKEK